MGRLKTIRRKKKNLATNGPVVVVGGTESKHPLKRVMYIWSQRKLIVQSQKFRRVGLPIIVVLVVGLSFGVYTLVTRDSKYVYDDLVRVKGSKEFQSAYEEYLEKSKTDESYIPNKEDYDKLTSIESEKPYYFYLDAARFYRSEGQIDKAKDNFIKAKEAYIKYQAKEETDAQVQSRLDYFDWEISGRTTDYEYK